MNAPTSITRRALLKSVGAVALIAAVPTAALSDAATTYSIEVIGDSMSPRFRAGEIVYVDRAAKVELGDYVVAEFHGPRDQPARFYIRQFVSMDVDHVQLRQLNPEETNDIRGNQLFALDKIILFGGGKRFDPARYVSDMAKSGHPVSAVTIDGRLASIGYSFPDEPISDAQRELCYAAIRRCRADPEGSRKVGEYCIRVGLAAYLPSGPDKADQPRPKRPGFLSPGEPLNIGRDWSPPKAM